MKTCRPHTQTIHLLSANVSVVFPSKIQSKIINKQMRLVHTHINRTVTGDYTTMLKSSASTMINEAPCVMISMLFQEYPLYSLYTFIIIASLLLLICPSAKILWFNVMDPPSKIVVREYNRNIPPGSGGLPWIGETLQFMSAMNTHMGIYEFVQARRQRYGNCFKTDIFGETHVFVSTTQSARMILNDDIGRFSKKYIKSIAELVGHESLLCASRKQHKLLRSRLLHLFSTKSLANFVRLFDELMIESITTWDHGGVVFILDQALKITCKATCKILIGIEGGLELEMLQKDVASVCDAMLAFPLRLPWTRFYKGLKARKRITSLLEKLICERRKRSGDCQEDFLQSLLRGNGDSCSLTNAEIQDNILAMIIAGQDTTASAITWMVKFLDENEEVLNTLMEEQFRIAKNARNSYLTMEDLNEMPYASKVVKESLRMASVVQWLPRLALADCEIEGFKIQRGWNVNVDARSIHFDPDIYSNPNVFNPFRFDCFTNNKQEEPKLSSSFLAFGMGGRTCLGMSMAKIMMLVFLHRLTTTYKWKVIDSDSSVKKWALFSKLRSGCPVYLTCIKQVTSPPTSKRNL
uniref:Cytochrome P450 oxidase CYP722A1 n=1 Tax=Polygala tenuifolia TaxID=355332 RepID=A0A3G5ANC8_9FABA|nr:cytochrome P450 oxidase CYP722A1 [Polygala tenuifolia]